MAFSFSISRSQAAVFITVAAVSLLAAGYFFIYIPGNSKELNEQRFRTLQRIDKNIHDKIDNSIALMNNLLEAHGNKKLDRKAVEKYITNYPQGDFTLTSIKSFDIKDSSFELKEVKKRISPISTSENVFSTIGVNDAREQFLLNVSTRQNNKREVLSMQYRFEQFLKPLLPENVFDEYIVFSRGSVVYETFSSGLSYQRKDSLLGIRNGISGATVRDLTVGGIEYKTFLQPVGFDSSNEWIVSGLVNAKRYQTETRQLPSVTIILLGTALIIMILALPWLKLYSMGNRDRLTMTDGVLCLLVSMLLMSVIFFAVLSIHSWQSAKSLSGSAENIRQKITDAFDKEISDAYTNLLAYDDIAAENKSLCTDIRQLGSFNTIRGNVYKEDTAKLEMKDDSIFYQLKNNFEIYEAYWLNKKGDELFNWNTNDRNAPHGNFSKREYYKAIAENRYWYLHGDTVKPFYLEQLISWTSGTFRTVISKPSAAGDSAAVVAFSFPVKCLDKTILPEGYQFAVTDITGKVLYHSVQSKNLNENILEEFSEKNELRSAYNAHAATDFITDYYGRQYKIMAAPMQYLPYFIIVLSDKTYESARDMRVYSFSLSMLFAFFIFLVIQLIAVLSAASSKSNFSKQPFITRWLCPRIPAHNEYSLASIANIFIILLLVFFFYKCSFAEYLFILLFSISASTAFLNIIFYVKYRERGNAKYSNYKKITIIIMVIFIVLVNASAIAFLDNAFSRFGIFEIFTCIILFMLNKYRKQVYAWLADENRNKKITESWRYIHSYSLMAITRLIVTSGIPVALFFYTSYNYEQSLLIRERQLDFTGRILEKYPNPEKLLSPRNADGFLASNGVYTDDAWIKAPSLVDTITLDPECFKHTREDMFTINILNSFRYYDNTVTVKNNAMFFPAASDSAFYFNHLFDNACKTGDSSVIFRKTAFPKQYIAASSGAAQYAPSLKTKPGLIFWLFILVLLVIYSRLLLGIIKKIFAIHIIEISGSSKLDDLILEDHILNKRLFINGLPGAAKLYSILEKIKNKEIKYNGETPFVYDEKSPGRNTVYIADFMEMPDSTQDATDIAKWRKTEDEVTREKYTCIIVNHFEYNINDAGANRKKLNFLERILAIRHKKLIVLSAIHPAVFIEAINLSQTASNEKKEGTKNIPIEDLERWHVLFGHFRIVTIPLANTKTAKGKTYQEDSILHETQYSHYLMQLRQPLIAHFTQNDKSDKKFSDMIAYNIQNTAYHFYAFIWHSLTLAEKLLLYDLAEDGLVNSSDYFNLNMLIQKGVIVSKDGTLQLFNKGFRNFILAGNGKDETKKIQQHLTDTGTWGKLKTPLLVIILSILAFMLASQQEAYSKLIAYLTALAGGIPVLAKVFSFFEKQPAKNN